jgi:hypothetical protein
LDYHLNHLNKNRNVTEGMKNTSNSQRTSAQSEFGQAVPETKKTFKKKTSNAQSPSTP